MSGHATAKVYVVAGRSEHARRFAEEAQLVRGSWRFVGEMHATVGRNLDGVLAFVLETASALRDYEEIMRTLDARGAQVLVVSLDRMLGAQR